MSFTAKLPPTKQISHPDRNYGASVIPCHSYSLRLRNIKIWPSLSFRARKIFYSIFFSWKYSVGTRVRSSTRLLQIWIDQLNHLPGLNGCWFFLAFLVVLRPPWVITSPPGGPHQQSAQDRRNFGFQCKNFHGLILSTKQTFVVWSEIYSTSLPVCPVLQDFLSGHKSKFWSCPIILEWVAVLTLSLLNLEENKNPHIRLVIPFILV